MLNIFAIDPEICRDPEWFRYCIEHCHPSQGRMIADLPPGGWDVEANKVIKKQASKEKEKKRQNRYLEMAKKQLVDRPGTVWKSLVYNNSPDPDPSWIIQTEKEHGREPFSAVVSPDYNETEDTDETEDTEPKYYPDELDRTVEAWNTPSGIAITRSPGDFVNAILPMLRLSKEIHFLDRYFSIDDNSSHTQNYKQIIEDLANNHNPPFYPFPSTLTIHFCPDSNRIPATNYIQNRLEKHYADLIPIGKSVKIFLWQIKQNITIERGGHPFHNRYVLSNHCGVFVGYGTDSFKAPTDAPDLLQVIDEKIYRTLLKQIRKKTFPMLDVQQDFVINGTKRV
ncbi:MAG: hypothetical protein OXN20_04940 [Gemmatimonadota bacterium]|nr:hypothetical protein [Gemmatimonadota bacterium]